MKKFILCISCIMIAILLSGCSMGNTPTKQVEKFLDSYKNNDETVLNQLKDMVDSDSLMDETQKEDYNKLMQKQYSDMKYEIKDEVIDGDTATVTVELEVYDFYKINKESETYYNAHQDEFNAKETAKTVGEAASDMVKGAGEVASDAAKGVGEAASDVTKGAGDVAEDAIDSVTSSAKFVAYRLSKLMDAKDRVTYTVDFTLTKVNNEWKLNDIDDVTRQKIHGLYEH